MLAVADLAASYGARPVLNSVSLAVAPGEIVALVGRNAAGKTTLLRALMGLLIPLHGSITLAGENITRLPAHRRARRGIGYVPQGRMVFPDLSVLENLLIGTDLRPGHGRSGVDDVLGRFPALATRLRQAAGTLSGGEQQMLSIARALAGGPKILLLDEPTAGVQPSVVDEITAQLRALSADRRMPMLLVEHNIEMVSGLCSRIYVMKDGMIARQITSEQVHDEAIIRAYLAV